MIKIYIRPPGQFKRGPESEEVRDRGMVKLPEGGIKAKKPDPAVPFNHGSKVDRCLSKEGSLKEALKILTE